MPGKDGMEAPLKTGMCSMPLPSINAMPVTNNEALEELERLLSDPNFQVSERHKNFLRYVVKESMEGRGEAIKAYSIAVDVFGRSTAFDSSKDPIVRIEARRLRAAMAQYYEARSDGIRIEIPKGRYVPRFVRAEANVEDAVTADGNSPADLEDTSRPLFRNPRNSPARIGWAGLLLVMVAALLGIGFLLFGPSPAPLPRFSEKPTVSIELEDLQNWTNEASSQIRNELFAALSSFFSLRLADSVDQKNATSIDPALKVIPVVRNYRVVLNLETAGGQHVVWWRVLNDANEAIQTGKQAAFLNPDDPSPEIKALASSLSRDIAGYRGAIPITETRLELDNPTLGNGCIQRVLVAFAERLEEQMAKGRECLQKTLALQPGNADARALLSLIILTAKPFETTPEETAAALELARSAVSLAPDSQLSVFVLTIALYHAREVQAAVLTGRRAMALNLNEYGPRAYLGWILFASGKWEEGVKLAKESLGKTPMFRNFDAGSTLLLDAYRRGDYALVLRILGERPYKRPYLAALTGIATLGQLGQEKEAAAAISALHKVRPGFEQSFVKDMEIRGIVPELAGSLGSGLTKAGLHIR